MWVSSSVVEQLTADQQVSGSIPEGPFWAAEGSRRRAHAAQRGVHQKPIHAAPSKTHAKQLIADLGCVMSVCDVWAAAGFLCVAQETRD